MQNYIRDLSRSTENYVHGITFRELHSQKHSENYSLRITFTKTFRALRFED